MKRPSSFEQPIKSGSFHLRNSLRFNHFPIPEFAHPFNPRKTRHLRTLPKIWGVWGYHSKNGIGNQTESYFAGVGATDGSFAPSKSTTTWFNSALIWPRSCAFVM